MGHRDSSEKQRGARCICEADERVGAIAARLVSQDAEMGGPAPTQIARRAAPESGRTLGVKSALLALRMYKMYLSILFAGSCRFEPTCSQYAYEATERFGVWRGVWLGMKRLLRCQPLSRRFGYDPVPETWHEIQSHTTSAELTTEAHS